MRACRLYMELHQGGRRCTGLGRAVKLSSTVVLPPSTAGSARIRGPKEAKGGGTNPSVVIKHIHSLREREKKKTSISLFIIFVCHSWHNSRRFATLQTPTWSPEANLLFLLNVVLFVWLSSTYTSLKV